MVWLKNSKSQLSKTFFGIENPLNIKEVMSKNVCVCSFHIFDVFDIPSITTPRCIWPIFDIFDIDSLTFRENENDISDIFDMSHTLYFVQITL